MILFQEMEVYVYGDGDHAREIQHGLEHGYMGMRQQFGDWRAHLIGKDDKFVPGVDPERVLHVIGVGRPEVRRRIHKLVGEVPWMSVQDSQCSLIDGFDPDAGCVFMAHSTIALGVQLGKHILVNYNASVGHDTIVGDYSVISPNSSIGGRCVLGEAVYIGAGANIREKTTIGDGAFVGMGALVTKDVPPNTIVIGTNEHYTREEWEARKNGSSG